jgi:uncharacterized peroxidase-related enzyme
MFLEHPEESEAVARIFDSDLEREGYVMNLTRLWAWRPDVFEAFTATRLLLTGESLLTDREVAVIVCATASTLGCAYCSLAWGNKLTKLAEPALAAAALGGPPSADMSAREAALATWAHKVVVDPNATTADDVERLRTSGLSEREIFEATALVAFRLAFSTINDALGAQPDWQIAEAASPEVAAVVGFGRQPAKRAA